MLCRCHAGHWSFQFPTLRQRRASRLASLAKTARRWERSKLVVMGLLSQISFVYYLDGNGVFAAVVASGSSLGNRHFEFG